MVDTRARILDTARELFNEHGLSRVGVREIARALDISPGNLAYHFATKDALVAALVRELHALNASTAFELPADFTLLSLYAAAVTAMRNMLAYRFVLLSYVDAVTSSEELRKLEAQLAVGRRARQEELVQRLVEAGELVRLPAQRLAWLHEQGRMISSGWLADAVVHGSPRGDRAIVLHHAKVGCALLEPHVTPRGARHMRRILAGGADDSVWPR
jgi:AcrR family transcriptional regulator